MKQFVFAFAAMCMWFGVCGAARVNLDSLYHVLDLTIDSANYYYEKKMNHIDKLKSLYRNAKTDAERFDFAKKLYQEYVPFANDSAIAYQYKCIDLAERMGRKDLYAESLVQLACQFTSSGFYNEARIHFDKVAHDELTGDVLTAYLQGTSHLYGELAYYSSDPRLRDEFMEECIEQHKALYAHLDSTSVTWLQLHTVTLNSEERLDEAMQYCNRWMEFCEPGTRMFATMAFYRSEIYRKTGDSEMQRYWLVRSALTDVRAAIMDQSALWNLANALISEGKDIDRAHRYIDFSWKCLTHFSTHMRSWLVTPVVTRINDEYKNQLRHANHILWWTTGAISLLLVGLLLLLYYVSRKRKQLADIRVEQIKTNKELASLNTMLQEKNGELSEANLLYSKTNGQLSEAVIHLNDSNRVKDEYIGKFLSLCSEYIDKLDDYRIKVNRKLKTKQYGDLLRMTNSEQLKEDELKELFNNFDSVFLRLFPTFVDDFNALLRPEERIFPTEKDHLNTDLRIFALIRLGIDESSKIAEFLHYSPNSIYSYRTRIKNKAAGKRDDFEKQVKEIGIQK